MTVSNLAPIVSAPGAGDTLSVAVPGRFHSDAEIKVYIVDHTLASQTIESLLVSGVGYKLTKVAVAGSSPPVYTGQVDTIGPVSATQKLVVFIDPKVEQTIDVTAKPYSAAEAELGFDLSAYRDAALRELVKRSWRLPLDYTGPQPLMTIGENGSALMWLNGNIVAVDLAALGGGDMMRAVYDQLGRNRDVFDFASQYRQGHYTQIDFLSSGLNEASMNRFNLTRQGSGSGNVVQSFSADPIYRNCYTQHVYNELAVINKFDPFGPATQTSIRWTKTPSIDVGHQGLAIEHLEAGGRKFWGSANYSYPSSKGKAVRFSLIDDPVDPQNLLISNIEVYTLFNDATGDGSTNATLSPDGRILVAKLILPSGLVRFRTWLLKDLVAGGPGDYSNSYVQQFDAAVGYDPVDYPLQDIATDGEFIYCLCGGSAATGDLRFKRLAKMTLDGSYVHLHTKLTVGLDLALTDGAGDFYELESLSVVRHAGRDVLAIAAASGNSGARVCRIHYLDGDRMVEGRGVGTRPAFISTGTNDFAVPATETMRFGHYDTFSNTWTEAARIMPDGSLEEEVAVKAPRFTLNMGYTAAQIANIAHAVNTTGKETGLVILDTTNHRLMIARGSAQNSAWDVADGSASVVPA